MKKISENLYIGTVNDIPTLISKEWKVINLSQKYHYSLHGWKKADPSHHCYVIHSDPKLLSVNWVDGSEKYFDYQGKGVVLFNRLLDYIDQTIKAGMPVFICCDRGISRSPTIALLYLAKKRKTIPDDFIDAGLAYFNIDKTYSPGGILDFIKHHWSEIK